MERYINNILQIWNICYLTITNPKPNHTHIYIYIPIMFSSQIRGATQRVGSRLLLAQQRTYATGGRIGPSFYAGELKKRGKNVFLWGGSLCLLLGWPVVFYAYNRKNYALEQL